jgi:hypothetical protein
MKHRTTKGIKQLRQEMFPMGDGGDSSKSGLLVSVWRLRTALPEGASAERLGGIRGLATVPVNGKLTRLPIAISKQGQRGWKNNIASACENTDARQRFNAISAWDGPPKGDEAVRFGGNPSHKVALFVQKSVSEPMLPDYPEAVRSQRDSVQVSICTEVPQVMQLTLHASCIEALMDLDVITEALFWDDKQPQNTFR